MTENPIVIDGEVEESTTTATARPFLVVTHKTPLSRLLAPYGAEQNLGGTVDPEMAALTLWWCSQDWASQVLAAGVALPQLLAPTAGFVARLDRKWLNREVGHLRKRDIPAFFAKHPGYLDEHPQVILSVGAEHSELRPPVVALSGDLAGAVFPSPYDGLPGDVVLQIDQPLDCAVEVRYWITDGQLTAACPYRMGVVSWESPLFLEMLFNTRGRELVGVADDAAKSFAAEVAGPPGYAVDLGVTLDSQVTVLRAWPSWSAEPFSADPTGVLQSLVASQDFDQIVDLDVWRWDPDLRIYDRAQPGTDESEEKH